MSPGGPGSNSNRLSQDNHEDHGSPNEEVELASSTPDGKGLESPDTEGDTEVSTQWADTEVPPMDVGGSLHLDAEVSWKSDIKNKDEQSRRLSPPLLLNRREQTGEL